MVLTRRAVWLSLAAGTCATACRGYETERPKDVADENIQVDVRHQVEATALRISYRATNRSSAPLFLFDVLHGEFEDGAFPLDRSGYVEINDDSVIVSRKLFPVPPLMLVEKPNIPFVTRLAAGGTHQDEFSVELPLIVRNPYLKPERVPGALSRNRRLFFELGFFVGADGTEGQGKLFRTDGGDRPGFSVFSSDRQRLIRKGPLAVVPVSTAADDA